MPDYTIDKLFEEYVFQRQSKVSADQALQLLAKLSPDLPEAERKKLSQMIRQWELHRQPPPPPPVSTTADVTDRIITVPTVMPPPPPTLLLCPTCNTPNPPESKYCYSCGNLLVAPTTVVMVSSTTGVLPDEADDPAMFGSLSMLVIFVHGFENQPLRVDVGERAMIIGRTDPNSGQKPDVDLAPYDAQERGVSRQHAILKREQQTLTLLDRGSVNHTFVNGEKLHPHEVRVIRDGDEIRFGRLPTRFTFQRQLRRLGD
jgi:hypothetical protein